MSSLQKLLIDNALSIVRENAGTRKNGQPASLRTQELTAETIKGICKRLHELGFRLTDPQTLGIKHIDAIVRDWHARGLSNKTMQNQYSRLKMFCMWIGKTSICSKKGIIAHLPNVDPQTLKVQTYADKSKSWSDNGIDLGLKIKEAGQHDRRLGIMLTLGVAFGLRRKEMIRIKPREADKNTHLEIGENIAKNGRYRIIPIEKGEFGTAQRWALEEAKKICKKGEHLGWQGLTYQQSLSRYNNYMIQIGITKKDSGVTGHGLRAQYAENLLILNGLMPPTLGGTREQMPKSKRDTILLQAANNLGHGNLHTSSAYFGTFSASSGEGIGERIGRVLPISLEHNHFALIHCDPKPLKDASGAYPVKTAKEKKGIRVTIVVEKPDQDDQHLSLAEFEKQYPQTIQAVLNQLSDVGL